MSTSTDLIKYRSLREELTKLSDIGTPLLPHQQRVVDRIKEQPGLVVVHGLGSGKTLTSIASQDALGMGADVIVPAALQENYLKERDKHLKGPKQPVNMQTLQAVSRNPDAIGKNPLLIIDEAHRLRESSGKASQNLRNLNNEKRMLLTGSPFYNRPSDISNLINMASGNKVLPVDQREFESKYIRDELVNPGFIDRTFRGVKPGVRQVVNPKTKGELKEVFKKWVDYHPGTKVDFPDVEEKVIYSDLTPKQVETYKALAASAAPWVAAKIRSGLPPSKQEAGDLNTFLNSSRQVMNTDAAYITDKTKAVAPKIDLAFKNLQETLKSNERAKAVIYSNYLESGINPYKERLLKAGIPFGEFTGEQTDKARQQLVKDYNANKLKALILSSAGGEGLDLKGTRLVQILDPHWNEEKIKQVQGRAARFRSHIDLPEQERKVSIERYLARMPEKGFIFKNREISPDEYLASLAKEKENLNKQFTELLHRY